MLPVLLDLKFIKIYTFGVFLALAFFWGLFLMWRNIRLTSFKEEELFDAVFISLGGGIFLSRVVYVLFNLADFGFDILKFLLINGYPGLSLYGGLTGFFLSLFIYFKSKKIKFMEVIDYFITPIFIVIGFGKMGSFFSGAEVGTKTDFILSIRYVGFDGLRHLTALYESILFFIGAFIAYRILFEIRKEKYSKGFLFYFFWLYMSLVYGIFDFLKDQKINIIDYSFNQIASIIILLTTGFYFVYYFRSLGLFIKRYGYKTFGKIAKAVRVAIIKGNRKSAKTDKGTKKE